MWVNCVPERAVGRKNTASDVGFIASFIVAVVFAANPNADFAVMTVMLAWKHNNYDYVPKSTLVGVFYPTAIGPINCHQTIIFLTSLVDRIRICVSHFSLCLNDKHEKVKWLRNNVLFWHYEHCEGDNKSTFRSICLPFSFFLFFLPIDQRRCSESFWEPSFKQVVRQQLK